MAEWLSLQQISISSRFSFLFVYVYSRSLSFHHPLFWWPVSKGLLRSKDRANLKDPRPWRWQSWEANPNKKQRTCNGRVVVGLGQPLSTSCKVDWFSLVTSLVSNMFIVSISQLHHPAPIPQQRKLIIYNSICFSISFYILEMVSTELPEHVGHQGHLFVQLRTLCQVSIALCRRNDEAQWRRHASANEEPTNTSAGLRLPFSGQDSERVLLTFM